MLTQAELEASYLQQRQVEARHSIAVTKALIANALQVHEVDFDALAQKVNAIDTLLDGDEKKEGYQAFAALSEKLNTVEATANNNKQSIANLQTAINNQIATLTQRVDGVELEARTGREALDARITALRTEYEGNIEKQLIINSQTESLLNDHKLRIEALEASKALNESRIASLENDNTLNKSEISQLKTALAAQTEALKQELARSQQVEAEIRSALSTERQRVDQLVTDAQHYLTRDDADSANLVGATAYCNELWADAGLPMKSGLSMPDGTTSV